MFLFQTKCGAHIVLCPECWLLTKAGTSFCRRRGMALCLLSSDERETKQRDNHWITLTHSACCVRDSVIVFCVLSTLQLFSFWGAFFFFFLMSVCLFLVAVIVVQVSVTTTTTTTCPCPFNFCSTLWLFVWFLRKKIATCFWV